MTIAHQRRPRRDVALAALTVALHGGVLLALLTGRSSAPERDRAPPFTLTLAAPAQHPPPVTVRHQNPHHSRPRLNALASTLPAPSTPAAPAPLPLPALLPILPPPRVQAIDGLDVGGPAGEGGSVGGGGDGGVGDGGGTPPRRVGGHISDRDYPASFAQAGIGGVVSVRYRVGLDGRASDCRITASSGTAALDAFTCGLIERRFRFRPARDGGGRPVSSIIVENHEWVMPPPSEPAPPRR